MLYQPTNIYPSMTGGLGNGVIDASKDLTVSWQVNGNSALLAFQITIYKNDSASTQVYTTGQISEGCPFYGTDYAGNTQFFSYTIPADSLASAGITNGYQYKLLIKQWWGSSNIYSVTQSSASAFITRATPTLQIGVLPTPIPSRSYTFTAEYKQEQGDGLNWIRWMIAAKQDGAYETLKDSGNIYGTSVFQFSYDGLFSGNSYAIRCEAQTENGVTVDTGWNDFAVLYTAEEIEGTLKACGSRKGNGVRLSIPGTVNIPATVSGNGEYDISNSVIHVGNGTTVTWDSVDGTNMDIPSFNPMLRFSAPYRGGSVEINGIAPDIGGFEIADVPFEPQITTYMSTAGIWIAFANDGIYYNNPTETSKEALKAGWKKAAFQLPEAETWKSCAVGRNKILAITDGTTGAVSEDGKTWKKTTLPGSGYRFSNYFWSKSLYIIGGAGNNGNAKFSYSSDAETWNAGTFTNTSTKKTGAAVSASSDYRQVLCVTDGGFAISSTDGIAWAVSSVTGENFSCVSLCGNRFFATVGDENDKSVLVTATGSQWDKYNVGIHLGYIDSLQQNVGDAIGISDGKIARMGFDAYDAFLHYTTDLGISEFGSGRFFSGNAGVYVACYKIDGSDDAKLIVGDGNAPTQTPFSAEISSSLYSEVESRTLPVSASWTKLIYGNGKYAAISGTSGSVIYGTDGKTWSVAGTGLSGCRDIAVCDGFFAILGSDGNLYATDTFSSFEKRGTPHADSPSSPMAIAYGGGMIICTGNAGCYVSTDGGYMWDYVGGPCGKHVCYGSGIFVSDGATSELSYSFDGRRWSTAAFREETFSTLRYVGGKFIAIPSGKKYVYYSDDGIQWNRSSQTEQGNVFYDVTYAYGMFIFATSTISDVTYVAYGTYDFRVFSSVAYHSAANQPTLHLIAFHDGETVSGLPSSGNLAYVFSEGPEAGLYTEVHGIPLKSYDMGYANSLSISKSKVSLIGSGSPVSHDYSIFPQFISVSSMRLAGDISCDYMMLAKDEIAYSTLQKFHTDPSYHPSDVERYFYADFNSGLNAGEFGTTGFTDMAIYRRSPNDSILTHVADISPNDGASVVDVGAVMGKTYTYYAYGIGTKNSSVLTSNDISLCFWDWVLLSCTTDTNGVYHPQQIFLFSNNVSSGDVSNNNSPNVLQNFTRYPTVQSSPWNYRSGTLTSLIGSVSGGKYCDSVELRNAITELSTTSRVLFLKNRKGDLIKIALSGAIEMETMDNSPQQAQTMKLPWVETGDAGGVSIVLTQNDGAWVQSLDSPVVMGCCGNGSGAAASYAYPLTILQQGKTTVYDGSEPKKVVITGGGSGGIVAEDDGNGNITIYG